MRNRRATAAVTVVLGVLGATVHRSAHGQSSEAPPPHAVASDSDELRRLYDEDQADRAPTAFNPNVFFRDRARLKRVKELFAAGGLHTANDYHHSAMILQHGEEPEDFLLAHELCVAAMSMGGNDRQTKWLAAASEDRFLMSIGRPQRFGTQFKSEGTGPVRLYTVGDGMTDELRRLMATPTLAEAKSREAAFNRK